MTGWFPDMGLPANLTEDVTQVIASGSKRATGMTRSEHKTKQASGDFDIYTQTIAGLEERMSAAVKDPRSAVTENLQQKARALEAMAPGRWESTDLEQAVNCAGDQQKALKGQVDAVGDAKGVLATVGSGFAVRITDFDVGLPHAHSHPPNLTPPNPVPVPLPSTGPVIPIPFISGASRALINGMPAARCGDMGLGVWCGGYFPMYEIFLGSSSVWIEGSRAARLAVDITKHCIFSMPKPTDPPLGPMVGMTISASPNVLVGGIPMPSLLDIAVGAGMQAFMSGLGKLVRKLKAGKAAKELGQTPSFSRSAQRNLDETTIPEIRGLDSIDRSFENLVQARNLLEAMERSGSLVVRGDPAFVKAVKEDLMEIALSKTGREVLEDINKSIRDAIIEPLNRAPDPAWRNSAHAWPASGGFNKPGTPEFPGGCDTFVRYDPKGGTPGSPSDVTLIHELGHARSFGEGMSLKDNSDGMTDAAKNQWTDWEEVEVIQEVDNPYRREKGLPIRKGHRHLPH
jgi:uncharacterized Zn-binding protein involved in type VI secretion